MKVLLVDDDPQILNATAACIPLLRPDWKVIVACDGLEALRLLRDGSVDILVADIQMPAMDGLSLLAEIRKDERLARLPMILTSGRVDRASMRSGMLSGADDYLTKPYSVDELIESIDARLRRVQEAFPEASVVRDNLRAVLTERELEVLGLIGRGLVTKDIAKNLRLSPATVSVHRANIMQKLGLHNSAALAALAVQAKLT